MHLHFERNVNTKCDCSILSLSWMGKVPDDIPEDDGWKLNRTNYYQEGWLATGNIRGIVGVTFTTSHCKKNMDYPLRTNYNLRGHRSDVILVKWNEPYQKLASCDSSGIIFVWIKYEGRWSIELINDRNTPVTHFSWSHDGRMALICYQDGFVLVGSVAGQRYWSSMLNLESTITCGIWTPDDQQVYFGTTHGQIIVMDVHGAMVSQVQLCSDIGITSMAWSCEKFKMEEGEEAEPGVTNASKRTFVLAVSFQNGFIYLLKSFDDVSPAHINTGINGALGFVMEWSNSRELLAVAGTSQNSQNMINPEGTPIFENLLKFYTENGTLLYTARIPNSTTAVSALTWGHNDKRLFIATGTQVHIAWVSRRVASLQLLCRLQIQASIGSELILPLLPLPSRIKSLIGNLFAQTIRCCVPDSKSLREFVSRPPVCSTRLHCTMIRHDDDSNLSSGTCYTLYLEYLGGLVPLLKGKRTSKIRPEFVIFDPQVNDSNVFFTYSPDSKSSSGSSSQSTTTGRSGPTDSSESDFDDKCRGSPRTPRKRKPRAKRRNYSGNGEKPNYTENETVDELAYVDTLPEEVKLVEVTSNIWGTKFKIHGLAKTVPANLGQVTYKTSLLHLQPRQMTLVITELRDDFPTGPDPNFNPNLFSEDEEDQMQINTLNYSNSSSSPVHQPQSTNQNNTSKPSQIAQRRLNESAPPIAPMSPRPNRFASIRGKQSSNSANSNNIGMSPLARAESYDDESPNETGDHSSPNNNYHKPPRPKNIETPTPRPGPSYTSFKNQYGRSSSGSCGQNRHAISPLCCEGSVPTLQSPKNAVAPSDIIFDRPPAAGQQTTLMSYSSSNDYTNSVVQVKNALLSDQNRSTNSHVNPVPLNLNLNLERMDAKLMKDKTTFTTHTINSVKKKEILFIDEENQSPNNVVSLNNNNNNNNNNNSNGNGNGNCNTTTAGITTSSSINGTVIESKIRRTPTIVSIAPALPDSITRSCSVGYLDSVEIIPSDEALLMLRKDAPKRLVLVDKKPHKKKKHHQEDLRKPKLQQSGKSKSLDSCDLLSTSITKSNINKDTEKLIAKLNEISDSETSTTPLPTRKFCIKCRNNYDHGKCNRCQNNLTSSSSSSPPPSQPPSSTVIHKNENNNNINNNNNNNNNHNNSSQSNIISTITNDSNIIDNEIILNSTTITTSTTTTNSNLISNNKMETNNAYNNRQSSTSKLFSRNKNNHSLFDTIVSKSMSSSTRKKTEVITSFTDSPLFTRKHRFGISGNSGNGSNNTNCKLINNNNNNNSNLNLNNNFNNVNNNNNNNINNNNETNGSNSRIFSGSESTNNSPILGRKNENGFSLVKQLSEVRRRRKEAQQLQQQQQEQQQQQQQQQIQPKQIHNQQQQPTQPHHHHHHHQSSSSSGSNDINTIEVTPVESKTSVSLHTQALTTLENIISRLRDLDEGRYTPPCSPQRLPRSSPASPAPSKKGKRHQSASPIRHILNSPLLNRRQKKKQSIESSDDEGNLTNGSGEESNCLNSKQYRDLETFQKAQLRQKLKRGKIEPNGTASSSNNTSPVRREFVMHNKAPMWNEMSQVYQLDFGGRVTQESAKNFQIEFRGKQVMQFGRIDGNAYTLDFQYPFSALQAFAVALANVTQRLK